MPDTERRRKCPINCPCLCHDTQGGVHPHYGRPCPGKYQAALEETQRSLLRAYDEVGRVLAALDGEADPVMLGVEEGPDADAIRRLSEETENPEDA